MPLVVPDSWRPGYGGLRAAYAVITTQALPELRDSASGRVSGLRTISNPCGAMMLRQRTGCRPVTGAASAVHRYAAERFSRLPPFFSE